MQYILTSRGKSIAGSNNFGSTAYGQIGSIYFGAGAGAQDATIAYEAANTLAQRNTTNAQIFRVYATTTDSSNYERLSIDTSSNVITFASQAAGYGTARNFNFSGGNIGIGTTSPGQKLSVAGDILGNNIIGSYFTATTSTASVFPYASTTALTISGTNGLQLATGLNGPLQANAGLVSATSSVGVLYGGTGLTSVASSSILLGTGGNSLLAVSTSSLGLMSGTAIGSGTQGQFPFYNAAGTTLTATSSLFVSQAGNIGVGTAAPAQALEISRNVAGTYTNSSNIRLSYSAQPTVYYADIQTLFSGTPSVNALNFAIAGGGGSTINALNLTQNGRVLFNGGLTTNTDSFEIKGANGMIGSLGIANNDWVASSAGTGLRLFPGASTGNTYYAIDVLTNGGSNGGNLILNSGAGSVGVGTTSPATTLSVAGNGYFTGGIGVGKVNTTANTVDVASGGSYRINGDRLLAASTTRNNLVVGDGGSTLYTTMTGTNNVAVGVNALTSQTTGGANNALGRDALLSNTTGEYNNAFGYNALRANVSGTGGSAFGSNALAVTTVGSNSAFGYYALSLNTTGVNDAFGNAALQNNTTGTSNTSFGYQSMNANITGNQNVAVGNLALANNGSATSTVAVGFEAGKGASGAYSQNNVFLGYQAGVANTTGNNNILLGYKAGDALTSGSTNIVIGYDVDAPSITSANTLNIGNLIFGTGLDGTGTTLSSGNVGIGTTSPGQKLSVAGDILGNNLIGSYFTATSTATASTLRKLNLLTDGTDALTNIAGVDSSGQEWWSIKNKNVGGGYGRGITFATRDGRDPILLQPDSTGKVGIGMATLPAYTLDVSGTVNATDYRIGTQARLYYASVGSGYVVSPVLASGDTRDFVLLQPSGGNVGIGTTNPTGVLSIGTHDLAVASPSLIIASSSTGVATTTLFSITNGNVTAAGTLNITGLTTLGYASTTQIGSTGSAYFATSAGNVGIGTTSPGQKLSVAGDILGNNIIGSYFTGTSTTASTFAGALTSSATTANTFPYASTTAFTASGLATVGTLGVGSTSPSTTLGVVGSGYFRDGIGAGVLNTTAGTIKADVRFDTGLTGTYRINGTDMLSASTTLANYFFAVKPGTLNTTMTGALNTGLGYGALNANTSANYNTAVGYNAMTATTDGGHNTSIGMQSMVTNTSGFQNSAIGSWSLRYNTIGSYNVAMGTGAVHGNTTGSFNVGIGIQSLYQNTSATNTIAIGYGAAQGAAAYYNQGGVYIGYNAGVNVGNASDYNTFVGHYAGNKVTTGARNIILGADSSSLNDNLTTGSGNIKVGYNMSFPSATADNQLNIGNLIYGTSVDGSGTTVSTGKIGIGSTTPWGKLSVTNTGTDASFVVEDQSSDTSPFLIDASGNVGIGTTSPATTLSVAGSGYFTGGIGIGKVQTTAGYIDVSATGGYAYNGIDIGVKASSTNLGFFIGPSAGSTINTTMTGAYNAGFGRNALQNNTTGAYNTAVGYYALQANTTGGGFNSGNTALGTYTLSSNTTGSLNTGLGSRALLSNTTGDYNTGVGTNALAGITGSDADYNTAVGQGAFGNGNGSNNAVLGANAMASIGNATNTVAIGASAGAGNGAWSYTDNVFIGTQSGYQTSGSYNTFVGSQTTNGNARTGSRNILLGYGADTVLSNDSYYMNLGNIIYGTSTTNAAIDQIGIGTTTPSARFAIKALGDSTGRAMAISNLTGVEKFTVLDSGLVGIGTTSPATTLSVGGSAYITTGLGVGKVNTTANTIDVANGGKYMYNGTNLIVASTTLRNTFVGQISGVNYSTTLTGTANNSVGYGTLNTLTTGASNNAFGDLAGGAVTTGSYNNLIGQQAGSILSTGSYNVAIGQQAMYYATSSSYNTAVGMSAMGGYGASDYSGGRNVALGAYALYANTTGTDNIAIGASTGGGHAPLYSNTTGVGNIAMGYQTLTSNTTGSSNTVIGYRSAPSSTGDTNSYFGAFAGFSNTTGLGNTGIGRGAFTSLTTGTYNTALGYGAGGASLANDVTTGSYNLALGYLAQVASSTLSNQLSIGNLIYGTGISNNSGGVATGNIGIGTTTPYSRLSVWGRGTGTGQLFSLINNASTTVMQVLDNGNVGIGTTSPGQKLSVAGDILGNNIIGSYFAATSSTATSTFAGFIDVNGTGTNATSTFASNLWIKGALRIGTNSIYLDGSTNATSTFTSGVNIAAGCFSVAGICVGAGGAGSGDMVAATYDPSNISEQLVGLTATQSLSNKTLTTLGSISDGVASWDGPTNTLSGFTAISGTTVTGGTLTDGMGFTANGGVVTSGGWNGTAIGATYGGTGIDTSAGTGIAHVSAGTWSLSAIDLASADVTGTLTVANGGTGVTTFADTNTLLYTSSTDTLSSLATAADSVLVTDGAGVPSISQTLPAAVQANIIAMGAVAAGSLASGFGAIDVGAITASGALTLTGLSSNPAPVNDSVAVCIDSVTHEVYQEAGDTCSLSSARFKHNIQSLNSSSGLTLVRQLRPVSFNLNSNNVAHVGLIAEEVAVLDSRLTFTDIGTTTIRGVRYEELTAILTKAIQELATTTSFISNSWASTTALMTIDANGNFGIGTTTPEYKLHVIGDIAATSFVNISTRAAKKDISYLSSEEESNILTKIKDINVATYHYSSETNTSPLRLGLIAEEAPVEVLSASGKGVDVYKLSTFLLAGIQAQQKRLESLEARVTSLESATSTSSASGGSITTYLVDLGLELTQNLLKIKAAIIDAITVKNITIKAEDPSQSGITIYDRVTGQPVCMFIANGLVSTEAGACSSTSASAPASAPTTSSGSGSTQSSESSGGASAPTGETSASASTTSSTETSSESSTSSTTPAPSPETTTPTETPTTSGTEITPVETASAPVESTPATEPVVESSPAPVETAPAPVEAPSAEPVQ